MCLPASESATARTPSSGQPDAPVQPRPSLPSKTDGDILPQQLSRKKAKSVL
jgi:hypothetical protein